MTPSHTTHRLEAWGGTFHRWLFVTEGSIDYCRDAVGRLVTGPGPYRILKITTTTEVVE